MQVIHRGAVLEATVVTTSKGESYYSFLAVDGRDRFMHVSNPHVQIVKPLTNGGHVATISDKNRATARLASMTISNRVNIKRAHSAGYCGR